MINEGFFNLITFGYLAIGAVTLYRLVRNWHSFFSKSLIYYDRELVWPVALFVLGPIGVLAHELAHYFFAIHYGATEVELHYRVYWGFVTYVTTQPFDSFQKLAITVVGPASSVILGFVAMIVGYLIPNRIALKATLVAFGLFQAFHSLIGYPLLDIASEFKGGFHSIYTTLSRQQQIVAAAIHVMLSATLVLTWRRFRSMGQTAI